MFGIIIQFGCKRKLILVHLRQQCVNSAFDVNSVSTVRQQCVTVRLTSTVCTHCYSATSNMDS